MDKKRIIDRLDEYIKANKLNDNKVTVSAGLSNGVLNQARRGKCDIGRKSIDKILDAYTDLNRVWLLTGEGEMILKPTISNTNSQVIGSHNTGSTVKVDSSSTEISAMVAMLQEQQRQNAETQRQNANLQSMMERFLTLMENSK